MLCAASEELNLLFTDKDGVLKQGSNASWGSQYAELLSGMGQNGNPFCITLSGSTYSQNKKFMKAYGLDDQLRENPAVQTFPYFIHFENGFLPMMY